MKLERKHLAALDILTILVCLITIFYTFDTQNKFEEKVTEECYENLGIKKSYYGELYISEPDRIELHTKSNSSNKHRGGGIIPAS